MTVFFFDTEINGTVSRDDEGVALPDLSTARREAMVALYGLASEVEPEGSEVRAVLRVRDGRDTVVLALDMSLVISQSAMAGSEASLSGAGR